MGGGSQSGLFSFPADRSPHPAAAREGSLGRVVFRSVSPGDAAWEGDAGVGSLPRGDGARGGQAGTETRDLVTANISPLLFPLSLKRTNLQNPWHRGCCATGPAVTAGPGYAAGHVGSADAVAPFPSHPQPQRPLFSGGGRKRPRNPVTRRPFPSGRPQPRFRGKAGRQLRLPAWQEGCRTEQVIPQRRPEPATCIP